MPIGLAIFLLGVIFLAIASPGFRWTLFVVVLIGGGALTWYATDQHRHDQVRVAAAKAASTGRWWEQYPLATPAEIASATSRLSSPGVLPQAPAPERP